MFGSLLNVCSAERVFGAVFGVLGVFGVFGSGLPWCSAEFGRRPRLV